MKVTTDRTTRWRSADRPVVGILWREALESPIYFPWLRNSSTDIEIRVIADYESAQLLSEDVDLLVTHNHYRWDELAVLRAALNSHDRGVLVLADGITEFRNSWDNPSTPAGCLMQPALAHKIATLGPAQSRVWESWGNHGKCESVGLPRLDESLDRFGWRGDGRSTAFPDPELPAAPTLLICSARTPAFAESQWEVVVAQFASLAESLRRDPPLMDGRPVHVYWRVSDRIREHLHLAADQCSTGDLATAIAGSTAVITTPSTLQLEAMVAHRPVALLNFFNVPLYVPAAWNMTSPSEISVMVRQLLSATADRMFFQQNVVRDQLWCESSATERMGVLVNTMAQIAHRQRQLGRAIQFPEQILPTSLAGSSAKIPWDKLIPERQQWLEQTRTEHSTLWELTAISAAMVRAREYSEERRQLHYISEVHQKLADVHQETVQAYEAALEEKRKVIEHLQKCLDDSQVRQQELKERLDKRNAEFERANQQIQQLSGDKILAHEKLVEAYADAKRKQDRVNELRSHYQEIREAHIKLKAKLEALSQTPSSQTQPPTYP
jgi:hypothetical protein